MDINDMFPSKFLRGEDLKGRAITVTMARVVAEKMYKPGQGEITGFVLYVQNGTKGVVLSKGLAQTIAQAIGEQNTDSWPGHQVVLYPQPMQVAGRNVVAIRAKAAPKPQPQVLPAKSNGQVTPTPEPPAGEPPEPEPQGVHEPAPVQPAPVQPTQGTNPPGVNLETIYPKSPRDWDSLYNKAAPFFGVSRAQAAAVGAEYQKRNEPFDAFVIFEALKAAWLEKQTG